MLLFAASKQHEHIQAREDNFSSTQFQNNLSEVSEITWIFITFPKTRISSSLYEQTNDEYFPTKKKS